MATRRRTSARKTAKTAPATVIKESPAIVVNLPEGTNLKKVTTKSRANVKKVTTTAPKRASKVTPKEVITKVTPKEVIKVTEVTNTPKVETLSNTKSLLNDYPRDIFALFLLPLFLLEAGTKEILKQTGVLA